MMSDKSPLFVSSVELLAHAVELYSQGVERKYKFVILHLANAVELILKDRLVDKGISIYVQRKPQTIGIWDAFEELQKVGINISERPVMELLIDDRNTIQHRFGFPNAETVFYYLEQTVAFFKRFLNEEYNVDLVEVLKLHLTEENLALIGLAEKKEDAYASLDKLFAISPESAVLQAYNLIERKYTEINGIKHPYRGRPIMLFQVPDFIHLLGDLAVEGYIPSDAPQKFTFLREMRNRAAHAAHFQDDLSSPEWKEALSLAKDLLAGLDKAAENNFIAKRKARMVLNDSDTTTANDSDDNQS